MKSSTTRLVKAGKPRRPSRSNSGKGFGKSTKSTKSKSNPSKRLFGNVYETLVEMGSVDSKVDYYQWLGEHAWQAERERLNREND